MKEHKVVSDNEWFKARKLLLKKENEFTVLRNQPNQQRREIPWKAVTNPYLFEGPNTKSYFGRVKIQTP